ncbi:hypothetical protein FSP39_011332 [Pinctada imbricata]|uniref:Uncharacterized protein n=1 Tax=Pinctada imbricata TaxID=66713 RepID=A0AA89BX21_PINIB|nr:hypothetical protein FSP39_011332 [Pinctada imbricata]
MDTLIGQYDFLKATEDDENEFVDKLNDLNIDSEGLTQKELLTILHAYKTKVCVEGFPKRMSPGYWMAFRALETLLSAVRYCRIIRLI